MRARYDEAPMHPLVACNALDVIAVEAFG